MAFPVGKFHAKYLAPAVPVNAQRAAAEMIVDKAGDHVPALKGNQGTLHEDVELYLDDPAAAGAAAGKLQSCKDLDGGHVRIETRIASVDHDVEWLRQRHHWPGLEAIGKVVATRESNGETKTGTRNYILGAQLSLERFQHAVRTHWSIETSLHWLLDVSMNENGQRNWCDNGPENLALMRCLALNIAPAEPSKDAMRGKINTIKKAGWSDDIMLDMILGTASLD